MFAYVLGLGSVQWIEILVSNYETGLPGRKTVVFEYNRNCTDLHGYLSMIFKAN